jgi:CRP-like cAMP-binding protein
MNAREDIARSAIWAGELTEDELDRARRGLVERHFSKGAYICHRGEGSVLKDEPRRYDLVVLRDTRLAMMSRSTFMWLYENSRGFNRYLVRALNERMGQFIATIEYDRILAPKARVARNLSWFFNRVLYPNAGDSVEISQEELGLLANVSRQVVNRSLQELEEEGLLKVGHGRIVALDIPGLMLYGA